MNSEAIGQLLGVLFTAIVSYLGIRSAMNGRKKGKGNGGGLLDTLTQLAQNAKSNDADTLSEKREDALDAMLTITDVLKETRAELVATRVVLQETRREREETRAELVASQEGREREVKARIDTDDAIEALRKDFAVFKTEASDREKRHQMQIEAQAQEIIELRQTNQRQRETIRSLKEYIERLVPLLKKAGIDTKELPQLPDILETNHGGTPVIETPAVTPKDTKAG